jgi:hypothetical protein
VVDSNDRDRIEDAREDSLPDTLDHIEVYRGKLTWRFFFGHPAEKLPVGHGAFEKNWVETHSSNHECQEFLLHPEVCLPEWLGHIHPIGVEQDAQRGEELRRWIGRNIGSRSISV